MPNSYAAYFNATFYENEFLNIAPNGTILFNFTLYINPMRVGLISTVFVLITSSVDNAVDGSNLLAFTSHNSDVYSHRISNLADYTIMDSVYYKKKSSIVTSYTFHLQILVPPSTIIGANNVGVTVIGELLLSWCSLNAKYLSPSF